MSYCRWSECDVYVYADVNGGWTTHVANRRPVYGKGPPVTGKTADEILESYNARAKWLKEHGQEHEEIFLPHSGETFNHATPQECAENLRKLKDLGFDVPEDVIEELQNEVVEDD